jgi:chromate transporter
MARTLCPDRERITLAAGGCVLALVLPSTIAQVGVIMIGALIGWRFLLADPGKDIAHMPIPIGRWFAIGALAAFVAMLIGLPLLASGTGNHAIQIVDSFYRSGSLVFGGGHVVLPLLQQAVVPPGWISNDAFLAGYGAAQAVPGPLFTFAAYLGTAMGPRPNGLVGGLICLIAIYLSSFLLLIGTLPFWDTLRRQNAVQSALKGVNAAVVGLLLAALYTPVWTSAIRGSTDFMIAVVAFVLLVFWKLPPWLVVILGAAAAAGAALVV